MRPFVSATARVCARCRGSAPRTSASAARGLSSSAHSTQLRTPPNTTTGHVRWLSQSSKFARPNSAASSAPASGESVPQTHYDFFPQSLPDGPPPNGRFPLDTRALRREFLQLQAKAHPDMHPADLKTRAEATSARINEAYKTLANPLYRAQYLLSLRGVDVATDETLKVEDPELLMMVLEAREAIEEAGEEEELEAVRQPNEERIRLSEEVLGEAFSKDDIETAKSEAVKLRYWINIKDSVDNWEKGKPVVLEH